MFNMNGIRMHLLNSLDFESEGLENTVHSPVFQNYDVSGWNSDKIKDFSMTKTPKPKRCPIRKRRDNIYEVLLKKLSPSPLPKTKSSVKLHLARSLPRSGPTVYKISKINLNEKQVFIKGKYHKHLEKKFKLPGIKQQKNFTTVIYSEPKQHKLYNSVNAANVIDILNILRPEIRNPVATVVTPQLLSKSILYKSFSRKTGKRSLDLSFSQSISPGSQNKLSQKIIISNKHNSIGA